METRTRWTRWELALLGLGLALLAVLWGHHLEHSSDDGFITYRYARNLALGRGLVFNEGEARLGTTAPGWALLLGALAWISSPELIPLISGLLSLAAMLGSIWLLSRRLLRGSPALLVATVCLLASNRWLIEVLGHEGFAQSALVLVALTLLEASRPAAAGLTWAASTFVRPDAGLMGAVAGVHEWCRRRQLPLRLLGGFVLLAVPAAVVQLWLAGSLVPSSLQVKLAEASEPTLAVLPGYWARLASWFWRCWGWGGAIALLLAACGWAALTSSRGPQARRVLLPTAAIFLFYPLVGVPFAPWYLVLPVMVLVVGQAAAVDSVLRRARPVPALAVVLLAALSTVPQVRWALGSLEEAPDPRAVPMWAVAQWIEAQSDPDDVVAAVEVGFLGFACQRPILDLIGICSPGALEALTAGGMPAFFLEHGPRFLVANERFGYLLDPLLEDPRFRSAYRPVWTLPPSTRYPSEVQIWCRQDP